MFADWVSGMETDPKGYSSDLIRSFEDRFMATITGQLPLPQELFRIFLREHELVHKLQQRGAFVVVDELPQDKKDIDAYSIYLLRNGELIEQYIYYNGQWEYLGNSSIDTSIFATEQEVTVALEQKVDNVEFRQLAKRVDDIKVQADNSENEALRKKLAEVEQLAYAGL